MPILPPKIQPVPKPKGLPPTDWITYPTTFVHHRDYQNCHDPNTATTLNRTSNPTSMQLYGRATTKLTHIHTKSNRPTKTNRPTTTSSRMQNMTTITAPSQPNKHMPTMQTNTAARNDHPQTTAATNANNASYHTGKQEHLKTTSPS